MNGHPARRWLTDLTGGAALFPLAVLFLLYFFDQFDTAAFGTLAPRIEEAFHLSDQRFGVVVVLNVSLVLLLAVPVSHLGDRLPRTRLVVAGGILAGVFSFLTGAVGTVALLVVVRIGNGVGQIVNDPVHTSLLTDYYAPDHRPRVFSAHRNAVYAGAVVGPVVAGVVSQLFGWRAAFMVLIVPIGIAALAGTRLPNPRRGGTDDPNAAAEVETESPVPLAQAWRGLWRVKTLKRQYFAYLFVGAGVIPLAYILPLYFKRAYGLGDFERGLILASTAAFQLAGLLLAGRWAKGWFSQGPGEPLRRTGWVLVGVGVGLPLVAAAPTLWLAILLSAATSFVAGMYFPGFLAVQALVSPARTRTLSFGVSAVFLVAGVWGLFLIWPMAGLSQHHIRPGLAVLGPYWIVGGLVLASASRFVAGDAASALRLLGVAVEQRHQRLRAKDQSLLVCSGVDVAYDGVQVLFGVDLEVKEGEIIALLGTNGAGKSTLLKGISGLCDPVGGGIFFDGEDITHLDPRSRTRLGIVQMPGGRGIFPTLTVNECLRIAGWLYRRQDPEHVRAATAKALEYFPILASRGETLAGNLSGGEQQMLGLAMAFIAKPRLLMIDELSLGLAPTVVSQLVDIVRAIHHQGATIILVEQSVNVALMLAERAVFMEKGEVRFSGPTGDLLDRGDILRSVFLEGAAAAVGVELDEGPNRRRRRTGRKDAAVEAEAAVPAAGAPPRRGRRRPTPPGVAEDAAVRLQLRGITVLFRALRAVDSVDLQVRDGEILGLIGPNGAGKTTLFDAISGFVKPTAGQVVLDGTDVTGWSPDRRSWLGLGRSFQDARIFPSLTVVENLALALERHLQIRDPVAAALGLPAMRESEDDAAWKVHDLVELLGLGAYRNKFASELSTGTRRVVDLGMTIAHQPRVLILDEPSSGIAQRETEALGPLLLRIQREIGCCMLVIEHDMPLITSISDTMVALELGAVIASGSPHDVVHHPAVVRSYLGTDQGVIARSGALVASRTRARPRRSPAGRAASGRARAPVP